MEQIITLSKEYAPTEVAYKDAQSAEDLLQHYKKLVAVKDWDAAKHAENGLSAYRQHLMVRYGVIEAPKHVARPPAVRKAPSGPDDRRRWIIQQNRKSAEKYERRVTEHDEFVRAVKQVISGAKQGAATKSEAGDLRAVEFMFKQYSQHFAANEFEKAEAVKERMRISLTRSAEVASEAPRRLAEWKRADEERRHREELNQRDRHHQELMNEQQRHAELMNLLLLRGRR